MKSSIYKALPGLLIAFTLFTMGCAQQHSVELKNGSLSFSFTNGEAKEIFFVSSIDQFHPHPVSKGPGNIWQVTVPFNEEFVFFYIVDGNITIPDCPNTVLDDFGSKNCLFVSSM